MIVTQAHGLGQVGPPDVRGIEDHDVRLVDDAPEELRPLRITDYRGVRPDGSR